MTVSWDGQAVDGIEKVTPLHTTTDVITVRDGGNGATTQLAGRTAVEGVTLERGVTGDLAFDRWATGPGLRKEVTLSMVDASDGLGVTYRLHRCWVSGYQVRPDLVAGTVDEAISLSVAAWERVTPAVPVLAVELARARGSEVQRVSLASVVSDHQDQTELNLTRLLDEAERSGAVLLLDEADALFGRRTEVADAHGRYDQTEADWLRTRLSQYRGTVLVTPPDPDDD